MMYAENLKNKKFERKTKRSTLSWVSSLELEWNEYEITYISSSDIFHKEVIKSQSEKLLNAVRIQFEEISEREMIEKRIKETGIVMVKQGKIYFANTPEKIRINILKELQHHKCRTCERLSAKPDHLGGCAKVRDRSIKYLPKTLEQLNEEHSKKQVARRDIIDSMRIEKYPFITEAIETVNTVDAETIVIRCKNYRKFCEC